MNPYVSDGIHPEASRRVYRAEIRKLKPSQKILFHITDPVFYTSFFITLAHITGFYFVSVVIGKIQITGIKDRSLTDQAAQNAAFEIIDHDLLWDATKEAKGILMAGQEMFHGL